MSEIEPLYKVTVLPASAIPVIVGVVSLVVVAVVVNEVGAFGGVVPVNNICWLASNSESDIPFNKKFPRESWQIE